MLPVWCESYSIPLRSLETTPTWALDGVRASPIAGEAIVI